MKKLLLTMLGVVGLLCSTSCSDEEIVSSVEGEAVAQFTVELTDGSDASRAISDGTTVDWLYYEVFTHLQNEAGEDVWTSMPQLKDSVELLNGTTETGGNKYAKVSLALVKGQAYDVVFWASKKNVYNTTNLRTITVAGEGSPANDETKDAFTEVYRTAKVTGPIKETIKLTRPFAQVNFGTLDVEAAKKAGITFGQSQITVTNAATTYDALSKLADEVGGTQVFVWANVPDMSKEALEVGTQTYEYLATAYMLVPGDETQKLSDVKMEIETGLNETITLNVPAAPVQRNYRTNILGNLLTNTADFTVEVNPFYEGDYNPIDMLKKVLTEGGEFTLFSDIVLNESITVPAGVEANINLNECTLTVNSSNKVEGALAFSNGNIMIDVEGEEELETAFSVRNGSTISLDDVNVTVSETSAAINVPNSQVEATVNISNTTMTIDGGAHGVSAAQGAKNLVINVEESTLTGTYAFYLMNTNSLVTIDDKSLVKDFWVMGGNVTVVYENNKPEIKTDGLAVTITYYNKGEYALQEAIKEGGEVTLTEDVTLTAPIEVLADFVLDLNGKTITADAESGYSIYNQNGNNLQIIDTTNEGVINGVVYTGENSTTVVDGGTYNAVEGGAYVFLNSAGSLTINNATINGGTNYPVFSYDEGHKLVINDATVNATFGCINTYGNGGVVEINGGTFQMTGVQGKTSHIAYFSTNSNVTINGGTFEKIGDISMSGTGGGGVCTSNGAQLTVKGGNFAGDYADFYIWGGTGTAISIMGGTYKFNPKSFLAEGYVAVQNADGTYTVKEGTAANDATSLENALSNATPGSTIVLSENKNYGTVTVGELNGVTIEGGEGSTMIFKTTADTKIENVTLNKINFEYTGAVADCGIVLDANAQIDNLVVENCTFVGNGSKAGRGLAYPNENASIVFKNCKFKDLGYPIWAFGGYKSLIVEGCTFENIKSWAIMPQSGFDGDLTVSNNNFVNCLGGGLIKAGTLTAGHTFTFTDNKITGCTVAGDHNWFQFNVSAGTAIISGNTMDGQAWTPGVSDGLK